MNSKALGMVCALLAAAANGTVGIFAKSLGSSELSPWAVAFYKCFLAMLVLGVILLAQRRLANTAQQGLRHPWMAACGFLGVFVMNTFEIHAYTMQSVATTVLMFLVGTTVITQVLSRILFAERITLGRSLALLLSLFGVYMILRVERLTGSMAGCMFGIVAGAGYGGYLLIVQKQKIQSSIPTIFQVTLWGSLMLFPGYAISGLVLPTLHDWWALAGLALVPTILGYYFTTLAISHVAASRVQLYELVEPLFAAVLAWLLLHETMTSTQIAGGICIVLAVFLGDRLDRFLQKKSVLLEDV